MNCWPPSVLLACTAGFAAAHNAWALLNAIGSMQWLSRRSRDEYPGPMKTKFVLLLPMLREEEIAAETLGFFTSLDYPQDAFIVAPVTVGSDGATTEVVRRWIAARTKAGPRVLHVHTSDEVACKADQLNEAMRILQGALTSWQDSETFLGVYDADSRPDSRTLREVDFRSSCDPETGIYQQGAVYFSGFDRLPCGIRGGYLRARPFYNLRFCLYRELPGFARSVLATRSGSSWLRALLSSPNHLLGHGEFIRADVLKKIGGFPPPSADTSFGTTASFCGIPIAPLGTMDVGETPASVWALYRQGITWYFGAALYLVIFREHGQWALRWAQSRSLCACDAGLRI